MRERTQVRKERMENTGKRIKCLEKGEKRLRKRRKGVVLKGKEGDKQRKSWKNTSEGEGDGG